MPDKAAELNEILIGEIIGLRLMVQSTLATLARVSGEGRSLVETVRHGALSGVSKNEVIADGMNKDNIYGRAEFVINDLCDRMLVTGEIKP